MKDLIALNKTGLVWCMLDALWVVCFGLLLWVTPPLVLVWAAVMGNSSSGIGLGCCYG